METSETFHGPALPTIGICWLTLAVFAASDDDDKVFSSRLECCCLLVASSVLFWLFTGVGGCGSSVHGVRLLLPVQGLLIVRPAALYLITGLDCLFSKSGLLLLVSVLSLLANVLPALGGRLPEGSGKVTASSGLSCLTVPACSWGL